MKKLAVVILLVFLSGCFSNSEVVLDRYSLIEDVKSEVFSSDYDIDVKLISILDEGGVVLKTSGVTLRPATNHRWATDLSGQLNVLLREAFLKKGVNSRNNYFLYITKFYGDITGKVEIACVITAKNSKEKIIFQKGA